MPEIIVKLGDNVVHKYFFDKDILNVGRARDNDITIENLAVSRNHARVRVVEGKYIITDLNSANGTYVNGVRITKTEIMHNDVVTIGKHNLIFLNKELSDEQIISDAFGADRTMIVDRSPAGVLVVTTGKQKNQDFKLTKKETTIGRSTNNDVKIHDWFVSKQHASIVKDKNNYFIKDLGSWRGVVVNGQPVKDAQLKDGDDIKLGATHITFHLRTEEPLQIKGRVPRELGYDESAEEEVSEYEDIQTPVSAGISGEEGDEDIEHEGLPDEEEEELAVGFERVEDEDEDEEEGEEKVAADADQAQLETPEEEIPEMAGVDAGEEEEEGEEEEKAGEEADAEVEEEEIAMADESEQEQGIMEEEEEEPETVAVDADRDVDEEYEELSGTALDREIKLWEKALDNKSEVIRKEAVRMLKKLTGKDYDF